MREDPGVERGIGQRRVKFEFLIVAYGVINPTGVDDIAKHDFAGLESCFTKSKFEELKHSDLRVDIKPQSILQLSMAYLPLCQNHTLS